MGSGTDIADALSRLVNIDWSIDTLRPSHDYLVREHLRRMALWAEATRYSNDWRLFDVADQLAPGISNPTARLEVWVGELSIPIGRGHSLARYFCLAFLKWSLLVKLQPAAVQMIDLLPPYEPVVRLYERGGRIDLRKGEVTSGLATFPRAPASVFRTIEPILNLDDASLDHLDEGDH